MNEIKLYTYFRSSAAYRVRIALNIKNIAYQAVIKHLTRDGGEHRKPAYLALNPQGLIPALDDEGTVLSQSLAIIEYLEERYPEPALLPVDSIARAQVRCMAQSIACDIHPLNNLRVLVYLREKLGQGEQALNGWYRHWINEGFKALEVWAVQHSADGKHCFGSDVTVADICLVPQVYNARRFNTDLASFPTLCGISSYLESLQAFKDAHPDNQPDSQY